MDSTEEKKNQKKINSADRKMHIFFSSSYAQKCYHKIVSEG